MLSLRVYKVFFFALLMAGGMIFGCVAFGASLEEMPPVNSTLYSGYQQITSTFWDAEHQLQQGVDPFSSRLLPYKSPLDKTDDPLYQKYFYVDNAAGKYLQILDARGITDSWTIPPVLYLGGVAAFTIGDYANAERYFSILLRDFSQYQREHYISENYSPDPDFSEPVKPGVSKLLFYCQMANRGSVIRGSGVSPEKVSSSTGEAPEPRDSFIAFEQFNQTALKVLLTQQEFAVWSANRPYRSDRRIFMNEDYGDSQPDKARASALPRMPQLIQSGWANLFSSALKESGAVAMRKYLRTLTTDDSSLRDIAAPRLAEVDELVIKQYFAEAKSLLRKHNFAATRKMYSKIISEYPDSDARRRAEGELPKVTPIAVSFFRASL